ncbi:DUF805 domain-containing protein [Litorimonas sp. WD9-15]|uniref:DUF805 domain-containing protein n=1 Tax=Litorimonas sp. WD9-15 TaxID=3418716 RepID=UPI003CFF10D8
MGSLLFSPSGRVGPADFMKGYTILIVIGLIINLLFAFAPMLALLSFPILIVLLWCSIALWIKRYHDAGKSGWMCLIPIIVGMVAGFVLSLILTPMFVDADAALAATEAAEAAAAEGDIGGAMSAAMGASGMTQMGMIISAVASAVLSYVIAMVFNGMIKHEDHDNRFGPETSTADTFS